MAIEGFRGSKEELADNFELSRRLQIRIGALLSKKFAISPTLLEEAQGGSPLENLLLNPALLQRASQLSEEDLESLWPEEYPCPLVVIDGEDRWKILAYEEELLAEEGFDQQRAEVEDETPGALPTLSQLTQPDAAARQTKAVFTEEELEKLRLELLTSAKGEVKIEALRKISLSSISPRDKGLLYLHCILDRDREVREEAAQALGRLGMSEEITECIRSFCGEKSSQKVFAVERLTRYIHQATALESAIAFHFLTRALEEEEVEAVIFAISKALREVALEIEQEELLFQLGKTLVRLLPEKDESYEVYFIKIFESMAKVAPSESLRDFIFHQLEVTENRDVRAFLIILMDKLEVADPSLRAEKLAHLLLQMKKSARHHYQVGKCLVDLGAPSFEPLLRNYREADEGVKNYIIQILHRLAENLDDPSLIEDLAFFFLDLIEGEDKTLKIQVYEGSFFKRNDFPKALKEKIARSLLEKLYEFNSPSLKNHLENIFRNLGPHVIEELRSFIESTIEDEMRNRGLKFLGKVSAQIKDEDQARHLFDFLKSRLGQPYIDQGELVLALAQLSRSEVAEKSQVQNLGRELLEKLWDTHYDYDILKALGHLSHSRHLSEEWREEVADILLEQIEKSPPEDVPLEADEEEVYHHEDHESEYFTDLIPSSLKALHKLAISPQVSRELRQRVLAPLIRKFREIKKWKVFWGPYNEARLAQILAEIALEDITEPEEKRKILKALRNQADKMYALRFLGQIFEKYNTMEEIGPVAAEIAFYLLRLKVKGKKYHDEINHMAHETLGIIAAHHHLGGGKYDGQRIREAVVQLLFEGIGKRVPGLESHLEAIAKSPATSEKLAQRIKEKLANLRAVKKYRKK